MIPEFLFANIFSLFLFTLLDEEHKYKNVFPNVLSGCMFNARKKIKTRLRYKERFLAAVLGNIRCIF